MKQVPVVKYLKNRHSFKACHCGEVFSTSEGLKEHKRAKHDIPAQSALTQLFSQPYFSITRSFTNQKIGNMQK
jgi:hypothetical protein